MGGYFGGCGCVGVGVGVGVGGFLPVLSLTFFLFFLGYDHYFRRKKEFNPETLKIQKQ
jgi:uncharacterized membrane protein YbaN (DUF454 family)